MLPAPRRGGGAAGLCPAAGPLPGLARQRARSSQRSLCVAAKAASFNSLAHWASASLFPPLAALGSAPGVSAPTFLLPMSNRRNAGGGALAQGRRETLGYAGGGGVWQAGAARRAAPRPAKQKSGPGDKSPGAALSGRAAPSRRPPSAGVLPCQASGPLPMSGPPACSAGKPETFSSQFSPAFFKSGPGGAGGRAVPRTAPPRGAGSPPHETPNGVQGQRPWRGPGRSPGHNVYFLRRWLACRAQRRSWKKKPR